ncbi:exopolyphosphatase/guanosine-5'-triphosphate,3'-diphosphate pyrophosphatase [Brevundimonas faecalis]|uniref:Exopolyphosphatase/guanosine-5'-triphosphate, 3'-diphosphate pyrophosphatase n=2 Tax=Brevundimonas faecalis TaxID=947378 RepID=A0ABV2R9K3_9CAUL
MSWLGGGLRSNLTGTGAGSDRPHESMPMPETPGAPRRRDARSQPTRSRNTGTSGRDAPLYGALDLGTNNCRLLIARPARDGFRVVDSFSRIVRLGEGLTRTGRLDDRAMDRAYDALALCAERVARKGLEPARLTAVATQACRAAENGPAFVDRVRRGTGLKLKIIDPAEEARLSVAGCLNLFDPQAEAVLVIDVGGGSTELSWLTRGSQGFDNRGWMSAPLGVVTLAERHPEPAEGVEAWYEAMVADVGAVLAQGGPNDDRVRPLFESGQVHMVGTSGAITSLAGIHLGLRRYQRDLVDGLWMTRADCEAAAERLKALGPAGRAAESCIGPDRADLVLAGAAILEAVQRAWPCDRVRVADRGLREGLLLQRMREDRQKPRRRRRRRRGGGGNGAGTPA